MVKFLSLLESRAQSLVWFTVQSLAFVLSHLYAGHFMLSGSRQQILETRVVTEGWKRQPLSPLQPYSLYGPCKYKLQAACKWEGLPILHDRYISPPCVPIKYRHPHHFAVKCANFDGTRVQVLLSFDWLASSYFAVNFKFWQQKKPRTYAQQVLLPFHWLALAVNVPVLAIW